MRKVKTASGAIAVQIARRENRRDVVVEHVGSGHTDAEVAALAAAGGRDAEAGDSWGLGRGGLVSGDLVLVLDGGQAAE